MLFNSVEFLIFFPIVVLSYLVIPRRLRAIWLLLASYFFYMSWNARYAVLIALSTLITWASGLCLDRPHGELTQGKRRALLAATCIVNLGILFFFKYFNFALDSVNRALSLLSVAPVRASLHVLLPVGISFYTFQALGYTIDVYRGKLPAERNLLRYALFVSFFPQLVAGPIERSGNLLRQIDDIENIHVRDYDRIASGLTLMLWGLFQKVVIADRISVLVDTVFDAPYRYGTVELLAGAVAFSLQIYCDFGAYSTIAVGAARVMGFRLMDNFDTPYFAQSIPDFWHRWHISLSTWFRDYLYIPMGGSRTSRLRRYGNILVTFLVSGLWHGAAWNYVFWGGLHGLYQVAGDLLARPLRRLGDLCRLDRSTFSHRLLKRVITFFLVTLAWIFFRANSLRDALFYVRRLFTRFDPWALFDDSLYGLGLDRFELHVLAVALLVLLAVDLLRFFRHEELWDFLKRQNLWFRWGCLIAMLLVLLVYGAYGTAFDSAQFIYFTF